MKSQQLLNKHGVQMSHSELKMALGFKPTHKYGHDEGWNRVAPDGTHVSLLTVTEAASVAKASIGAGSHRLFACCKRCDRYVPAGRLHQHYKKH